MIQNRISSSLRKSIYRREGYRCALCDNPQHLQIHHLCARGRGGSDNPHNLIALCHICHAAAHAQYFHPIEGITPADIEQACVEYLADYYAPDWCPEWFKE